MMAKSYRAGILICAGCAVILAGLLALGQMPLAAQNNISFPAPGVVTVEDARLNGRAGPGTDFAIVAKLDPGTAVTVVGASDNGAWYQIETGAVDGRIWVSAEFIAIGAGTTSQTTASSTTTSSALPAGTQEETASNAVTGANEVVSLLPTPTPRPNAASTGSQLLPTPTATAATQPATGTRSASSLPGTTSSDILTGSITLTSTGSTTATGPATGTASLTNSTPALAANVTPSVARPVTSTQAATNTVTTTDTGTPALTVDAPALSGDNDQAEEVQVEVAAAEVEEDEPTQAAAPPPPTATPAPTPSVPTAYTQPANMNVREGPGTNYPILTSVPSGTALAILAFSPDGEWYQVQLNNSDALGFVLARLTQAAGPMDGLRRLTPEEVPAAPTPDPVAVAASVSSAPPIVSAPPPAGGGFFGYGIQAHMLGNNAGQALDATKDLGFNWIKQQVEWRLFQPQPGPAGFGELHGIVNEAGARGINVLFSVVNAPEWARGASFDGSVGGPPEDPQTYANFVGAMAGEFCDTALKAIEVWNEQNLHYEWGNKPLDPAEYMRLLKAAYASIKAACPQMLVISGALTPAGSNPPFAMDDFAYLEGMYQNGLAQYSDGIGAHPSGYNVPASVRHEEACSVIQQTGNSFNGACDTPHHSWSFRSTMEGYRNIMVVYGDANKRIWPTEFGWAAGGAFDPRYAYANDNSFDEQAAWTVEAYQMMKAWGWVGPAFLWNLNFRVVADGTEKAQWGIVGNDWQPLPTYNALKAMPK